MDYSLVGRRKDMCGGLKVVWKHGEVLSFDVLVLLVIMSIILLVIMSIKTWGSAKLPIYFSPKSCL